MSCMFQTKQRSSHFQSCEKSERCGQFSPEKSKSTLSSEFLVSFIYQNSDKTGHLSFHSMHLGLTSEAKYPPLGRAESRNAAALVARVYLL